MKRKSWRESQKAHLLTTVRSILAKKGIALEQTPGMSDGDITSSTGIGLKGLALLRQEYPTLEHLAALAALDRLGDTEDSKLLRRHILALYKGMYYSWWANEEEG